MPRTFLQLFVITIFSFLISCNTNSSSSEKRIQTENPGLLQAEKNNSVSKNKTSSQKLNNNETTEKSASKAQPDTLGFYKVLTYKNIAFTVKAQGKGSLQQVIIQPSGLTATNRAEMLETEPVTGAEIGDLNADGYPELLIFTQSAGSGSYGKVIAFSVNNGKSMSQANFPEISHNQEIKKGYSGHDKFAIVNNTLTHEFPVYNEGDANSNPTGMKRQITYKLKNGENSRFFEVDQVKEIPKK